jgi:hypothetical protein
VPNVKKLKDKIFQEAHKFTFSIHLGGNKMYHDLKATYRWYRIKRDVTKNVALFETPIGESSPSINDPLGCCKCCSTQVKVESDWYGFCYGIA